MRIGRRCLRTSDGYLPTDQDDDDELDTSFSWRRRRVECATVVGAAVAAEGAMSVPHATAVNATSIVHTAHSQALPMRKPIFAIHIGDVDERDGL